MKCQILFSRENKKKIITNLSSAESANSLVSANTLVVFYSDHSKVVPLFLFVRGVVSYAKFILSFFVPHLFFFWYLGRAVPRDCCVSRIFLLIFSFFCKTKQVPFLYSRADFSVFSAVFQ